MTENRHTAPQRRTSFEDDGGTTAAGRGSIVQRAAFVAPRDAVRWGPIVAGLVTALSLFLLLSLLALGVGVTAADNANAGEQAGPVAAAVAAIIGLLSFVIGGFIAGRAAAVSGRGSGALNGFLVWALGVTSILILSAMGLSQLFGAAGDIFGQVQQTNIDPNVEVDPEQAADAVRNSAIVGFLSLALPAIAATIGGVIGARDRDEVIEEV
jgi:hypothetical protein